MSHLRRNFVEIVRWLDDRVVKKGMRLLLSLGLAPKAFALLETAGWRTRLPRQTPVGNGLIGNTFWLIAARGEAAHYVRNLRQNPAVRVKIGRTWWTGVAEVLLDDDPDGRVADILAHYGWLRRFDARALESSIRMLGTTPLVVRITLDAARLSGNPHPARDRAALRRRAAGGDARRHHRDQPAGPDPARRVPSPDRDRRGGAGMDPAARRPATAPCNRWRPRTNLSAYVLHWGGEHATIGELLATSTPDQTPAQAVGLGRCLAARRARHRSRPDHRMARRARRSARPLQGCSLGAQLLPPPTQRPLEAGEDPLPHRRLRPGHRSRRPTVGRGRSPYPRQQTHHRLGPPDPATTASPPCTARRLRAEPFRESEEPAAAAARSQRMMPERHFGSPRAVGSAIRS